MSVYPINPLYTSIHDMNVRNDGNDGGLLQSTNGDVTTRVLEELLGYLPCTWRQCHNDSYQTVRALNAYTSPPVKVYRAVDSTASARGSGPQLRREYQITTILIAPKNDTIHGMPYFVKVKIVAHGDVALCCK